jgi:hypothetical protein
MADALTIYNRADVVNFMNVSTTSSPSYKRMQGFTEAGKSMNSTTYDRRYVDETTERSTVTGYSTAIGYNFDRIVGNDIHEKICDIHDNELVGQTVDILTVDVKTNNARLRTYSVIPDADGDSTDAMTYSGEFHADGSITRGTATISADGLTATFTPTVSVE